MAEVASGMKDRGMIWGVVTLAAPYIMEQSGQVPVKIFTAKNESDFISEIPVEVFVKEKGACLEDGDVFPLSIMTKRWY